ncbi:hypothetical protein [Ferruginibacter sp.]
MAKESIFGVFEKIISPFHHMTIALTSIAALSVHAFFTQLFEPLTHMYYSVLLTFPLTATLLVIFLVLYNTNWKKVGFFHVILSVMPIALLLMLFTFISEKYGLEKMGAEGLHEKGEVAEPVKKDTPVYKIDPLATPSSAFDPTGIQKLLAADSLRRYNEAHPAWYEKIAITKSIASAIGFLWEQGKTMYANYGRIRFISGILVALFLAWYIQVKGINKLSRPKNSDKE